jgi:hypothetical protein
MQKDGTMVSGATREPERAKELIDKWGFLIANAFGPEVELAFGAEILEPARKTLTELLDKLLEDTNAVKADLGLNGRGQVERLVPLGNTARKTLQNVMQTKRGKLAYEMRNAIKAAEPKLPTPKELATSNGTDTTTLSLRMVSIWDALKARTDLEREADLMVGAEQNDLELLVAVENAPAILRLVKDDVVKKARERWLELNRPDEFKRKSTVEQAIDLFESNIQTAWKEIGRICGMPLEDDTVELQYGRLQKTYTDPVTSEA